MATQLDAFTAYFQDQVANEQRRYDEDTSLKADESTPQTGNSKKEQNRMAARKMREKQRSAKTKVEICIKQYQSENQSLQKKVDKLMNDTSILKDFILNDVSRLSQHKKVLDVAKTSIARPAEPNLILPDKTQTVVVAKSTAPARSKVAPPAASVVPSAESFNIPLFLLDSDHTQLPTQVDTKSKTSKIVEPDLMPLEPCQPCEEQNIGPGDEDLNLGLDIGLVVEMADDPIIKELLQETKTAPFDLQYSQMTMETQMPEFSKDFNTQLDLDFLNNFENISQDFSTATLSVNNQNMESGFNQFFFPGSHNQEYGDRFYSEPQINGYEMANTGFRLDPIGQSLNPATGFYEPTPPGANFYNNDAFFGVNPSIGIDVYP